jgi:hypothetical protein
MKKILILFVFFLFCFSCGSNEKPTKNTVTVRGWNVSECCLNGVKYYLTGGGCLTPVYDRNRQIVLCGEKE